MSNIGIDYGLGRSNCDPSNGIRYGVISQHSISSWALSETLEGDYGEPSCPNCGSSPEDFQDELHAEFILSGFAIADYACTECRLVFSSEDAFPDEIIGLVYDSEEYHVESCLDSDLIVTKSPFYTFAQFCSPCVPGAGNLDTPMPEGVKTYCLGSDWFEDDQAPYPVFRVSDDSLVSL